MADDTGVNVLGDGKPLQFGVTMPFNDHQVGYDIFLELARTTERTGFDSVWMADHLTGPTPMGATRWYDVVVLLAAIAAQVPRIRIGTDIIVAAYRHPVLAAKMLMTLDAASGGRLTIGVATGYIEKEFEDLGLSFADRGAYTTECLQVWKEMWSPGNANFEGKFFKLVEVVAEPKPVQQPHPPIQIGGDAPGVLRRVAELADGWHPIGLGVEGLKGKLSQLKDFAAQAGRTRPITLTYSGMFGLVTEEDNMAENRGLMTGGVSQVIDDVAQLRELGFTEFLFRPGLGSVSNDDVLRQVEFVGEKVLPRISRA